MGMILVYLRLYGDCLRQGIRGLKKNLWTILLPTGLYVAWFLLVGLLSSLPGIVAGLLVALVLDALASCYLYFVAEIVSNSTVSLSELRRSFGAFFWSILNLNFVLWIGGMLLSFVVGGTSHQGWVGAAVSLIALVLLSAAPESIYLKGTYGGLATVQSSIAFVQEHWIEWLLPSVLLGAALVYIPAVLPYGTAGLVLTMLLRGVLFHVAMLFRGHLFTALDRSTHRQRMFKYRSS